MNKQTFSIKTLSTIKVVVLALVLGLGISYAQAVWTGPTAPPTGNNVEAPVNIGPTAQIKTGDLTVGGLTLSKFTGGGVLGSFVSPSGVYKSALFLNSTFSGFFNEANTTWRWTVSENGDTNQPGKANASDFCINSGANSGKCLGTTPTYSIAIISGFKISGVTFDTTVCRMNTLTGMTDCVINTGSSYSQPVWTNTPSPFGFSPPPPGSYSLVCESTNSELGGGNSYFICCRVNNITNAIECKQRVSTASSWGNNIASPF